MDWTPEPGWLDRMDAGENRSALLDEALIKVALLPSNRSNATSGQTLGVVAGYSGLLGAHRALQDILLVTSSSRAYRRRKRMEKVAGP